VAAASERLDPRAIEKMSGPAWHELRPSFDQLCEALLDVSSDAKGELTTIYIKFTAPETENQPFAVLWIKKTTELTLGLALPDDLKAPQLAGPPKGCKYAGLTKYLVLRIGDDLPAEIQRWSKKAYDTVRNKTGK